MMTRPISVLLNSSEIINNQGSAFTKSLYAMKGLAKDFRDLRSKHGYDLRHISEAILTQFGDFISAQSLADFENLNLRCDKFHQVSLGRFSNFNSKLF